MNQPAKVLVVEDDATLRQALCDTIKFGGYEAVEASSGVDASTLVTVPSNASSGVSFVSVHR